MKLSTLFICLTLISPTAYSISENDVISEDEATEYYQSQLNDPMVDCYKRNDQFECMTGKSGELTYFTPPRQVVNLVILNKISQDDDDGDVTKK